MSTRKTAAGVIVTPDLVFDQRGSTWTCHYPDVTQWPFILIARHVYYGTDRLLATTTLARVAGTDSITVLTSHINLLISSQRDNFSKLVARRLKGSVEAAPEAIQTAVDAMLDGMLERLVASQDEIEVFSASEIVIPADLTPKYALWPIVPISRAGMLVAPSGQGKSSIAAAMGLSVVTGTKVLDRFEPSEEGPVLYIGQEEDKEQWAARITMICRGLEIEVPKHYYYLRLKGGSLIESSDLLSEMAATKKAKLVIVDSAQATWGNEGDGNVRGYATHWFNSLNEIGVPTLVIEHPNLSETKKPDSSGGFAAGSSVKRDRVGHAWSMRSIELPAADGQPTRYHSTLKDTKRNYVARQPDIMYETLIYRHDWVKFMETEALTAGTVIESSRLGDTLAAVMRDTSDTHPEGWNLRELQERLGQKDERRIRMELTLDVWRPARWSPGTVYRFEKVEGTGTRGFGNPALFVIRTKIDLESPQMQFDPEQFDPEMARDE